MALTKQRFDKTLDIFFLISAFLLVIGTPLVFTSLTRSVFEVNKLLLLRVLTLFTYGLWLYKYLVYRRNEVESTEPTYRIGTVRWKKMGLEIPLIAWTILNVISTIFLIGGGGD